MPSLSASTCGAARGSKCSKQVRQSGLAGTGGVDADGTGRARTLSALGAGTALATSAAALDIAAGCGTDFESWHPPANAQKSAKNPGFD